MDYLSPGNLSLYCDYRPNIWPELKGLPALTTITLKEPQLDAAAMQQIVTAAPQLTTFAINSDVVMDSQALLPLKGLKHLRHLDLSRTSQIQTEALARILKNKPIESLLLSGCTELDASLLDVVRSLGKGLQSLAIDGIALDCEDIASLITMLPRLVSLSIGGDSFAPMAYDQQLMLAVMTRKELRSLGLINLHGMVVDDLKPLTKLPLKQLDLHGMPLDDEAIIKVFAATKIRLRLPNGKWLRPR